MSKTKGVGDIKIYGPDQLTQNWTEASKLDIVVGTEWTLKVGRMLRSEHLCHPVP